MNGQKQGRSSASLPRQLPNRQATSLRDASLRKRKQTAEQNPKLPVATTHLLPNPNPFRYSLIKVLLKHPIPSRWTMQNATRPVKRRRRRLPTHPKNHQSPQHRAFQRPTTSRFGLPVPHSIQYSHIPSYAPLFYCCQPRVLFLSSNRSRSPSSLPYPCSYSAPPSS